MSIGLFILRLVVGLTLAAHGAQKLFGWFRGYGISGTASFLERLGFRPGRLQAALAGLAEFGGGLFLALGLLTPAAAAVCVAVMLVAGVSVHWKNGFFVTGGGFEYTAVLGASAAAIAVTGPGRFSADAVLGISWPPASAVVAIAVGIAAAAVLLVTRRKSVAESVSKAA